MTEKYALLFYTIKIVSFSASTWISHIAAYHILEGLRLRLTDRFLKAPLGDVEGHSIGEIKSIMVEKIENMEFLYNGALYVRQPIITKEIGTNRDLVVPETNSTTKTSISTK